MCLKKNHLVYLKFFTPLIAGFLLFALLLGGAQLLNLNASSEGKNTNQSKATDALTNYVYWSAVLTNQSLALTNEKLKGIINAASVAQESSKPDALTKELGARFFWGISAIFFVFLCVCIGAVSWGFCDYGYYRKGYHRLWWLAVILTFVVVFFMTARPNSQSALSGGMAAGELLKLLEGAPFPGPVLESISPKPINHVWVVESFLTAFAAAALTTVALAACRLGWYFSWLNVSHPNSVAKFEKFAVKGLNLLQLTAVTLVCGVFEVFFLYSVVSYHVDPLIKIDVEYFARSAATATGLIYSGLLAVIFVPLAITQRIVGRKILEEQPHVDDHDKELVRAFAQTDVSALPVIKAGLVILSPVIASILTKVLGSITGDF